MTRPPNWLYRRFDRSPLSVPLDTSVNAPLRGAKVCFTKGGRTDRWPQTTAIPTRTILLYIDITNSDNMPVSCIGPRASHRRDGARTSLRAETRTHGGILPSSILLEGGPDANGRLTPLRGILNPPGRRIGQRGDATRAPTQGPRPGWAARCRPSAPRDWPERDKSIYNHQIAC
jgi:hypothetical protein